MRRLFAYLIALLPGVAAFTGCGLVDEDMGDCETDYTLDYELSLVTNMTTELQTELSLAADIGISNALRKHLSGIFTDHAHDVDLSFYDTEIDEAAGDAIRLHHESHIMDGNQSSYTLYIPVRRYMHLAVANIAGNGDLVLEGDGLCHGARLTMPVRDTLDSQRTGLFTARLAMDVKEGEDQTFDVSLYMANCASSVVVDTLGTGIRGIRAYATGFATGFNVCDSTYNFAYTPVVRTEQVEMNEPGRICFTAVTFPSRETPTKSVLDIDDPFVSEAAENALWRYYLYVDMPDGTVTQSILGVTHPLRPGQLKIIKVKVTSNGSVQPDDPSIAVSVALDWTPGIDLDVDL